MNRRDFIKTGSGAFFIASAGKAFGADAPSNRVRLAMVGCHAKGRGCQVRRSALKLPGVEIAYVCDVDSRALDFAAAEVEKRLSAAEAPDERADLVLGTAPEDEFRRRIECEVVHRFPAFP